MFEFLRLPFGLRNAGQTFQWFMDQVLGGLPYCFLYVDDILVFSPDLSSHGVHLLSRNFLLWQTNLLSRDFLVWLIIKDAPLIRAPLTNGLKQLVWSSTMESTFLQSNRHLSAMPTLVHPAPGLALLVAVDASESHVGAVLQHQMRGNWFPLSVYSRKLKDAERKYSAFYRELLAAYSAIPPLLLHAWRKKF